MKDANTSLFGAWMFAWGALSGFLIAVAGERWYW